jgi:ABC-type glycerol-3-phosphate transport system substrate-binding protein
MVLTLALSIAPGVALAEKATLRFVDTIPDQNRQRVYQEIIDEFNAKHDDVQVVYESVPWDQAHQKLVVMAGADNLPDILYVHTNWFSEFQSAGWVLPLDKYYDNWALKDDRWCPSARSSASPATWPPTRCSCAPTG